MKEPLSWYGGASKKYPIKTFFEAFSQCFICQMEENW